MSDPETAPIPAPTALERIFPERLTSMDVSSLLCVLLPATLFAASGQLHSAAGLLAGFLVVFVLVLGFFWVAGYVNFLPLTAFCCAGAATYYGFLLLVLTYNASPWSKDFSAVFLAEYLNEIIPTALQLFGIWKVAAVGALLACAWLGLFALFFRLLHRIRTAFPEIGRSWQPAIVALIGIVWISTNTIAYGEPIALSISGYEPDDAEGATQLRKGIFPDYSDFRTDSDESIFILQLESVSSMTLLRPFTMGGKSYAGNYLPQMEDIAKDGVFMPFFLANQSPTNPAQETIHCGIVGNNGRPMSRRLQDLPKACLPALLNESGYKTIAFRSDRLEFTNIGNFMKEVGFDEIHHEDIMQPKDVKYPWGYDDCTFYKRAFDYLRATYPDGKKLYVYFEVSSHHWPFDAKKEYESVYPIAEPDGMLERYINSASAQDSCLKTFYDEFKRYSNEHTHLTIHSDHGSPPQVTRPKEGMYAKGMHSGMFFIPYVYIPPRLRRDEFAAGSVRSKTELLAEEDLFPTYLELLSGKPYANSFVYALKNQPMNPLLYERCHVLTNGSYPSMAVVMDNREYVMYSAETKEVISVDLVNDFNMEHPKTIATGVSSEEFRRAYYCPRYQRDLYARPDSPGD